MGRARNMFPQPLGTLNPDGLARLEALAFPAAIGVFADNLDLGKVASYFDQVDGVDFYFVFLYGSVSFPARAFRRCEAGVEGPLHDGFNFPDCQGVEVFFVTVTSFQGSDFQLFANDTFEEAIHLRGFHSDLLLGALVGQRLQLAVVIVNHGVGARVPVEVLLQPEGEVPDFVFIVGRTTVILLLIATDQFHADVFFAGDAADSGEGLGQVLAFLDEACEFDFHNFHGNLSFLLAVAIFFGDEVIEPTRHLVAGEGVEGLQFVPGGPEAAFADMFEYGVEVAGVCSEHLGQFGVFFPFALILPAGDHVFESLEVVCEFRVNFHGPVFPFFIWW